MSGPGPFASVISPAQAVRPRLLVAEDDLGTRRFLEEVLGPLYEVDAVADGEQAWSAMQRTTAALLLTDLQMPVLDGLSLIRRVRSQPCFDSLPIIVLTASQEKELVRQCLAAGADDFLLKPFSYLELLACLQVELLAPRAARDHGATFQARLLAMRMDVPGA